MTPAERTKAWKEANRYSYNKYQRELMKKRYRPRTHTVMRPVITPEGVGSITSKS